MFRGGQELRSVRHLLNSFLSEPLQINFRSISSLLIGDGIARLKPALQQRILSPGMLSQILPGELSREAALPFEDRRFEPVPQGRRDGGRSCEAERNDGEIAGYAVRIHAPIE